MTSGASFCNRLRNLEISKIPPVLIEEKLKCIPTPITIPSVKDLLYKAVQQLAEKEGTKEEITTMAETIYPQLNQD